MTIRNPANKNIDFPVSYDWITNKTHSFLPRDLSEDIKFMTANMFLAMDKSFQHLLRKCTTSWIVSLTFGVDTVHMNLYDTEAVDDPKTMMMSTSVTHRAVFVEVTRDPTTKVMIIKPVDATRAKRAAHTGAFLYSARSLRPAEQQMLSNMHQTAEVDSFSAELQDSSQELA